MKYIIKSSKGTYFRCQTNIGPCFGATKEEAAQFATKEEAMLMQTSHSFAFVGSTIESAEGKKQNEHV